MGHTFSRRHALIIGRALMAHADLVDRGLAPKEDGAAVVAASHALLAGTKGRDAQWNNARRLAQGLFPAEQAIQARKYTVREAKRKQSPALSSILAADVFFDDYEADIREGTRKPGTREATVYGHVMFSMF